MRKYLVILIPFLFTNCTDNESALKNEISLLKAKNDSLNTILDTLKTKFIFDNAFIKHIVNENKPMKAGEKYQGEFYFVAYNRNDKVLFKQDQSPESDTLSKIMGGGYIYEFTAKKGANNFHFKPIILDKTAKEFRNTFFNVNISDKRIIE